MTMTNSAVILLHLYLHVLCIISGSAHVCLHCALYLHKCKHGVDIYIHTYIHSTHTHTRNAVPPLSTVLNLSMCETYITGDHQQALATQAS